MKPHTLIAIAAVACLPLTSAFARLGESETECEARYGKPTSVGKPNNDGEQLNMYKSAGFNIEVWFLKGRAECVVFEGGNIGTEDAMQTIMRANSQGHAWRQIEPWGAWTLRWSRDDGARARLRPVSGGTFVVESKTWIDRSAAKENPGLNRF